VVFFCCLLDGGGRGAESVRGGGGGGGVGWLHGLVQYSVADHHGNRRGAYMKRKVSCNFFSVKVVIFSCHFKDYKRLLDINFIFEM